MDIEQNNIEDNTQDEDIEFKTDMSFSMSEANRLSIVIFFASVIVLSLPYIFTWGIDGYYEGLKVFLFNFVVTIPILLVGIFVHELIHGLFIAISGKDGFSNVKFGFNTDYYAPYAHSKVPLKAFQYKLSTVAPLIILGLLPVIISLFTQNTFMLFFGIVFTFTSSGDILVLWKIRKVKKNNLVADHPERAGCFVYDNPFE